MKAILLSNEEIEKFGVETWASTQARLYAADCAESVLFIYEHACPQDKRPRHAIASARDYARMIEAKMPRPCIEASRRALIRAAEEAKEAAFEAAILLNNQAANYAALAAAHAAALNGNMAYHAMDAIHAARQAALCARDEARAAQRGKEV